MNDRFEYFKERYDSRRNEYLKECEICGSTENLEVDHIDPLDKTTHRIWTWSIERIEEELAKCQVLCHDCHVRKTLANGDHLREYPTGSDHHNSKLTEDDVREIRRRVSNGESQAQMVREFPVNASTINNIVSRKVWKHV